MRLAARKGADRPLGIFLQIIEERRIVAILHAFNDGKMQLEQLLHGVEDATQRLRPRCAGDVLNPPIGHEVKIKLGTYPLDNTRQMQSRIFGAFLGIRSFGEGSKHWRSCRDRKAKPSWMITAARSWFSTVAQNASSKLPTKTGS